MERRVGNSTDKFVTQAEVGTGSVRGLASTVTDSCGYPGSDAGSTCGREVATASGGGNTESSATGRESSRVGGFGKYVTVVSFQTTATEEASSTATRPTGLELSDVFLMWEVRSCCDSVPKLGWRAEKTPGGGGGVL